MTRYNLLRRFATWRAIGLALLGIAVLMYYFLLRIQLTTGGRPELVSRSPRLVQTINFIDNLFYLHSNQQQESIPSLTITINTPPAKPNPGENIYLPATITDKGTTERGSVYFQPPSPGPFFTAEKKSFSFDFSNKKEALEFAVPEDSNFLERSVNYFRAKKLNLPISKAEWVLVTLSGQPQIFWQTSNSPKQFPKGYSAIDDRDEQLVKLNELITNSNSTDFEKNIFSLINKEHLYSWIVYSALANSTLAPTAWYKNDQTGLLTFAPALTANSHYPDFFSDTHIYLASSDLLVKRILENTRHREELNERFIRYFGDYTNALQEELALYDTTASQTRAGFLADRGRLYSDRDFDTSISKGRERTITRYNYFKKVFTHPEITVIASRKPNGQVFSVQIKTTSLMPLTLTAARLTLTSTTAATGEISSPQQKLCHADKTSGATLEFTCAPQVIAPAVAIFIPPEEKNLTVYRAIPQTSTLALTLSQPIKLTDIKNFDITLTNNTTHQTYLPNSISLVNSP